MKFQLGRSTSATEYTNTNPAVDIHHMLSTSAILNYSPFT